MNANRWVQYNRELNLHAMRMGPGKHLKGRTLMGGLVKPEQVSLTTIPFFDTD